MIQHKSFNIHYELDRGTLLAILQEAGISREEFISEWR